MSTRPFSAQLTDLGWSRRLRDDAARAARNQTRLQQNVTEIVLERAIELGATGFALTGSTARRRRTSISDLDYHVIGRRPDVSDLPGEVDVVATSPERFRRQVLEGDDFPQWTLRYGCILHDSGPLRKGVALIAENGLWPDGERKLHSLDDHRPEVERLLHMGDRDAAQEQLRAMLTTAARGLLLQAGTFPLARRELPAQLERADLKELAGILRELISGAPPLEELEAGLRSLDHTLASVQALSVA